MDNLAKMVVSIFSKVNVWRIMRAARVCVIYRIKIYDIPNKKSFLKNII